MPVNFNSQGVSPEQVLSSFAGHGADKIGDKQVLYVDPKKQGVVRGNTAHELITGKNEWKAERQAAKDKVCKWLKGLGLSENDTQSLTGRVQQKTELLGKDLREIAAEAKTKLEPFAKAPLDVPEKCAPQDAKRIALWLDMNKDKAIVALKTDNGTWQFRLDSPSCDKRQRLDVGLAMREIGLSAAAAVCEKKLAFVEAKLKEHREHSPERSLLYKQQRLLKEQLDIIRDDRADPYPLTGDDVIKAFMKQGRGNAERGAEVGGLSGKELQGMLQSRFRLLQPELDALEPKLEDDFKFSAFME